jgi:hypothetical protein
VKVRTRGDGAQLMACLSLEAFVQRNGLSAKRIVEESIRSGDRVATLCEYECHVEVFDMCPHGCHSIVAQLMLAGHTWNEVCDLFSGGVRQTARPP